METLFVDRFNYWTVFIKIENESYHPLRHRNAGDVRKFRTVSHGGSNTKVKKLYEAAKKVFEIGKCARRAHLGEAWRMKRILLR